MRAVLLAFVVLVTLGCAAVPADLEAGRDSGTTTFYRAPPEEAMQHAEAILRDEFDSVSPGPKPLSLRAAGGDGGMRTLFGVWVEPSTDGCLVTALTLRSIPVQLYVVLTESTFHHRLLRRIDPKATPPDSEE